MRSVSVRLADLDRVKINLGFAGENEHTHVLFDCKKALDQYPNATPFLIVTPPRGDIYPAIVTRDGDIVEWVVTDSDLIYHGNGKVQLQFKQGDIIMKSYEAMTSIAKSSEPTGTVPTPIQNWITQANAILAAIPDDINAALAAAKASGEFDGADGVGIASIAYQSTSGLVDTYTITLTDGNSYDFTVTNGRNGDNGVGIQSIAKTGTVGLVDTYTITLTNGQEYTFTVTNGQGSSIVIDDVTPAADKVFSSAKVAEELTDVKNDIQGMTTATAGDVGKALSPKTVTDGEVTEWQFVEGGGGSVDPAVIAQKVADWCDENITEDPTVVIDTSLLVSGAAADSKATGQQIGAISRTTRNIFDELVFVNTSGITLGQNGYYEGKSSVFSTSFASLLPIDGSYKANTRYNISFKYYYSDVTTFSGTAFTVKVFYTDETSVNMIFVSTANTTEYSSSQATAEGKTVDHIAFVVNDWHANNYTLHIKEFQIEEGTAKTEYVPHKTAYDIVAQKEVENIRSNINDELELFRDGYPLDLTASAITTQSIPSGTKIAIDVTSKIGDSSVYTEGYSSTIYATFTKTGRYEFTTTNEGKLHFYVSSGGALKGTLTIRSRFDVKTYTVGGSGADFATFTGMLIALEDDSTEKIVYVNPGEYDIFTEMGGAEYIASIAPDVSELNWRDVCHVVPPNTTIIGIGEVILKWLPTGQQMINSAVAFLFSPLNVSGTCSIENITVISQNCRYTLHDETSSLEKYNGAKHYYKDCTFKLLSGSYGGYTYGAGHNRLMDVEFERCVFVSENSNGIWSTHDTYTPKNSPSRFVLKDCIFSGTLNDPYIAFSSSDQNGRKDTVMICGCYIPKIKMITDGNAAKQGYDITLIGCNVVPVEYSENVTDRYEIKQYNSIQQAT